MVKIKCIMIGMMSVSALSFGAESSMTQSFVGSSRANQNPLWAVFDCKMIQVPGPKLFYMPIIAGHVYETTVLANLFSSQKMQWPNRFRGCAGFVSGPNQDLAKAIADEISARIPEWEIEQDGRHQGLLNETYLIDACRKINGNDVTRVSDAKNTRVQLFRFKSSHENPRLELVSALQLLKDLEVTDDLRSQLISQTESLASEESHAVSLGGQFLLLPANAMYLMHDLNNFTDQSKSTAAERFAALKQYAQLVCDKAAESHPAPVLVLDEERCAAFLEKIFENKE